MCACVRACVCVRVRACECDERERDREFSVQQLHIAHFDFYFHNDTQGERAGEGEANITSKIVKSLFKQIKCARNLLTNKLGIKNFH